MPAKKTTDSKESSALTPAQELKQLRNIVFGEAQNQLSSRIFDI